MPAARTQRPAKSSSSTSAIGAPAQYAQTNRKGKKAWRKNIDIQPEERALERKREVETVLGPQADQSTGAAYVVDVQGDAEIRRKVKSRPVLKSLAALSQRSAMPALSSRARPASSASASTERVHKQPKLSAEEKERLLRIARKGAVRALDGMGMGSASLATKGVEAAALKDVWGADGRAIEDDDDDEHEAGRRAKVPVPAPDAWGYEARLRDVKPRAPVTYARQRDLQATLSATKALPIPDAGISYNPKLEAYQALLDAAVQEEMTRLERERQQEQRIEKFRHVARMNAVPTERGVAPGMTVAAGDKEALALEQLAQGSGVDAHDGPDVFHQLAQFKKSVMPRRKTQADRNRIARRRAAEQKLAEARAAKKLRAHLAALPSLKAQAEARAKAAAAAEERKRERERELARSGMAPGKRMGKHLVQGRDVEVQLGEDLSENLRQLKPEGNLFRDRFLSLQQRALVEPRVRQMPTKRVLKIKEYEKHDFKRFDRD
ncbi:hypothetical protein NliqN6_3236 [Naganishia liquefaciens]|uniref:Ribosome biogenesis protein NOP53 n=1 Tax=Naganishia liquefaciens TaxID=104408 RepID=A0A8H3TTN3_9TREE|nr:hypothetical protein NliqN6_3236 [Naganishia liquefaciens]